MGKNIIRRCTTLNPNKVEVSSLERCLGTESSNKNEEQARQIAFYEEWIRPFFSIDDIETPILKKNE